MMRIARGNAVLAFYFAVCMAIMVPYATAAPAAQYVRTESGRLRCIVHPDRIVCEASGPDSTGFPQAPISMPESQCRNSPCPGGIHFDLAEVTTSGAFQWQDGNIGGGGTPQNDLVLNYGQTYHLSGWTVIPNSDGTRFTNDATGHGMFVSVENVSSF
ncbi:hypothetical protein [Mycobacterium sp. 1465703.0]|uniref:hypothetical protein n=1 Tax=Mycobacterium sp. 1465703.0 TaxID=1834078 RepID=UPI000800D22A|nr:hypothetical protein [Mycobacterium sp. 1465703.0]OBJ10884.1 hypothetical protein A5625_10470 [Mycobacterium sp. 1465703.0]